jgi:hypothetical protein
MTGDITKRLNDRMAQIYHKTGTPPKRLSLALSQYPELVKETTSAGPFFDFTPRGATRFCGIRLRVRDYKRERTKKWYGAGPMLITHTLAIGS